MSEDETINREMEYLYSHFFSFPKWSVYDMKSNRYYNELEDT